MSTLRASVSRRLFVARAAQWAAASLAAPYLVRAAAPRATLLETRTISPQPQYYHGWPTVARRKNGELWVTWSGGRESHVDPFGQVRSMTSRDDGATWSWPRVLLDSDIDDRDAGVLETARGTLLVTTFTSLAYEPHLQKAQMFGDLKDSGWTSKPMPPEQVARWQAVHRRLNDAERKAELGEWLIRSTDGGRTWSPRIATLVNSPHGPVPLRDGRLLYAGKELWSGQRRVGVAVSSDDGLSWSWLAPIPPRAGDKASAYHELHAVEAADGTLVVHLRNHNPAENGWTLQTESKDGGRTWSEPHAVCFGLPSHLLRLQDDRLLMSYGYRRKPYGNRARVSADHGRTWSEECVISEDGRDGDLGYPSTVQLSDGSLLTVWYESSQKPTLAVLRAAKWRLS